VPEKRYRIHGQVKTGSDPDPANKKSESGRSSRDIADYADYSMHSKIFGCPAADLNVDYDPVLPSLFG